ncbi:MAG: polyribonucleotide nucleotidyltransferase, partial [Candidatus Binatia bacterium]|nr:polyribonucleotide nucleotidyltransferase [Candidatus Binatia bacterium]
MDNKSNSDSSPAFSVEKQIGGHLLRISTGELAQQAGGSVLVQYGDTVVLGTATMGRPFAPDADFMPLLVEYEEKFYAAGKIKGSRFIKREGKPTDDAILVARLIDRSIRPLFPDDMINDIQVVCTVLSYDGENDPDIPALIAAAGALMLSDVPWQGPLGAVRVGMIDDRFVINPTVEEREQSQLDLVVAGTGDSIAMLEAGANEVTEDSMLDAMDEAKKALGLMTPLLAELQQKRGKNKKEPILAAKNEYAEERVPALAKEKLIQKLDQATTKEAIGHAENETCLEVISEFSEENKEKIKERDVRKIVHSLHADYFRERVLKDGWRTDRRALDEIRPLSIRTGILPRTHGSAIFHRGNTQVLTVLTLGGPTDVLFLDTMEVEEKKRYIHYYNFPAYSVGEIKPNRGPGRREIGHGALAERALMPVLPDKEKWGPYTMLLVSEVLESHGSSSMASVCGSTLALMDGGVPIKKPVAGIAMGLVSAGNDNFKVLTDIAGIEDEKGDMDFKVAGTRDGITAIQMDIKVTGLSREVLSSALAQARDARLFILDAMQTVIDQPRAEMSPYAPRIETVRVPVEKIGDLIGPKGKHINEIIEETGVEIDIEDDGLVSITSNDGQAMAKAMEWVKNMTRAIKAGERFEGRVTRIMDFGAFVQVTPNAEGMVHISQFSDKRVEKINDIVKVGDVIPVVVLEIDQMGRINLSHKAALPGGNPTPSPDNQRPPRRSGHNNHSNRPGPFHG